MILFKWFKTLCSPVVTICTAQWSLYVPHSGHCMYRPVVTICTASLTFNNSTFCPHSVFACFVWIWEQTAIISLYSINWLVFITEMKSVYSAVRTGSLNQTYSFVFKGFIFYFKFLIRNINITSYNSQKCTVSELCLGEQSAYWL